MANYPGSRHSLTEKMSPGEALLAYILAKSRTGYLRPENSPANQMIAEDTNEVWKNHRTEKDIRSLLRQISRNRLKMEDFLG
ncbi:MAG: hypothetical protein KKB21_02150 [Nanoarchaeota archaeon]|nr:hypothetical protein [Nanoarchaeota archaeon]MBU4086357.1 hypothetical protein [Nanoarchaeota archaeon]